MLLLNQNDDQISQTLQDQKTERIQTVKHKLFVLVLCVVFFFFYPFFISALESVKWSDLVASIFQYKDWRMKGIVHAHGDWWIVSDLEYAQEQIELQTKKKDAMLLEQKEIDKIKNPAILDRVRWCFEQQACDWFNSSLLARLPELRTFSIISQLSWSKMLFDQKLLLGNIEKQLLSTTEGNKFAEMHAITFSQPIIVNEKSGVYKIPFIMTVEFSSIDDFINFLHAVEKKMPDTDGVLYKIGAINYNIAKYKQNQKVDITLYAYYYR